MSDATSELTDVGEPHDFRPKACRWGWNGLTFNKVGIAPIRVGTEAAMTAIGRGVKPGDHVLLSHGGVEVVWRLCSVTYDSNPPDAFSASMVMVGVPADPEAPE